MAGLLRHRQTKGAATDRLGLRDAESCFLLYPNFLTHVVRFQMLRPATESDAEEPSAVPTRSMHRTGMGSMAKIG